MNTAVQYSIDAIKDRVESIMLMHTLLKPSFSKSVSMQLYPRLVSLHNFLLLSMNTSHMLLNRVGSNAQL
jgi:hypothetical protein